jgi:hypothetical protein
MACLPSPQRWCFAAVGKVILLGSPMALRLVKVGSRQQLWLGEG